MRPGFFEGLRQGGADCPSDLALDRLHARELDDDAAHALETHRAQCDRCRARMADRALGFDAPHAPDARRLLAGIRTRLDEAPPSLATQVRRWLAPALIAGVATAAAIVVVVGQVGPADTVRWKGDAAGLHVFRLQDGRAVEALSGDHFEAGDRLRFTVDLADEGRVSVVGVEPTGKLYRAWPLEGRPPVLPRGQGLELPGAVALDDAPGPETLYLVHCPATVLDLACRSTGASTPPTCADGCTTSAFVLDKP